MVHATRQAVRALRLGEWNFVPTARPDWSSRQLLRRMRGARSSGLAGPVGRLFWRELAEGVR